MKKLYTMEMHLILSTQFEIDEDDTAMNKVEFEAYTTAKEIKHHILSADSTIIILEAKTKKIQPTTE